MPAGGSSRCPWGAALGPVSFRLGARVPGPGRRGHAPILLGRERSDRPPDAHSRSPARPGSSRPCPDPPRARALGPSTGRSLALSRPARVVAAMPRSSSGASARTVHRTLTRALLRRNGARSLGHREPGGSANHARSLPFRRRDHFVGSGQVSAPSGSGTRSPGWGAGPAHPAPPGIVAAVLPRGSNVRNKGGAMGPASAQPSNVRAARVPSEPRAGARTLPRGSNVRNKGGANGPAPPSAAGHRVALKKLSCTKCTRVLENTNSRVVGNAGGARDQRSPGYTAARRSRPSRWRAGTRMLPRGSNVRNKAPVVFRRSNGARNQGFGMDGARTSPDAGFAVERTTRAFGRQPRAELHPGAKRSQRMVPLVFPQVNRVRNRVPRTRPAGRPRRASPGKQCSQ